MTTHIRKALSLGIFVFIFSFLFPGNVLATVGGPSYISRIVHDSENKAVYYLNNDNSGSGCPSIVHRINLDSKQTSEVRSCREIFSSGYSEDVYTQYNSFIEKTIGSFPSLTSINLRKNKITVDVSALSKFIDEDALGGWTNFAMQVKQEGSTKAEIEFKGCLPEQPHIVEGYMIPNSNILLLLISRVGDCYEGGYVYESIYLVDGINYIDKTIVRFNKDAVATDVNVGNLVVYASQESIDKVEVGDAISDPIPTLIKETSLAENFPVENIKKEVFPASKPQYLLFAFPLIAALCFFAFLIIADNRPKQSN